jgi:hypothetical protein
MAIFPSLKHELVVQVNDKTRLDATHSFVSKDSAAIESIEINPDGSGFIDTGSDYYLDWVYTTAGSKTPQVRITLVGGANQTNSYSLTVKTAADDNLFSNDDDLQNHEPDILKWIREGRNSYLDMHRRSQELILDTLYRLGFTDSTGGRLTSADVKDVLEIKEWSTFLTLHVIFKGLSNAVEDVFSKKAEYYLAEMEKRKESATLKLDYNGDGTVSEGERYDMRTIKVERR